jgi:hypothetical protein
LVFYDTSLSVVSRRAVGDDLVGLEVVPESEAELLFEMVERLVLAGLSVEILEACAKSVSRNTAPKPANLRVDVSAKIDVLAKMSVEGEEGLAACSRGTGL